MSFWNIFGNMAVSDKGETITRLSDIMSNYLIAASSVPTFFRGERAVEAQIPNICRGHVV